MPLETIIAGNAPAPSGQALHLLPTTSGETVTAFVHFYRGELSRMISWRDRLDLTTNWAIGAVAAMMSISLSSSDSHHAVLLFAMMIVFVLLRIEARRYRFFHIYRSRIRLLERYYFAQIFAPIPGHSSQWLSVIGDDLRFPQFTITMRQAMSRRLRRNYCWIFLFLLLAWLLKTSSAILQPGGSDEMIHSPSELVANAAMAGIPGELVLVSVAAFYAWIVFVALWYRVADVQLGAGNAHV